TRHRQRLRRRGCRARRRGAATGAARARARAERALLRPARARARRGYPHGPPARRALAHRPARRLSAGCGARRADRGAGEAPTRAVSTLPVLEEDQMRIEPIEAPKGLLMRLSYRLLRQRLGKTITPWKVIFARLPAAIPSQLGIYWGLERGVRLDRDLPLVLQALVAGMNGC